MIDMDWRAHLICARVSIAIRALSITILKLRLVGTSTRCAFIRRNGRAFGVKRKSKRLWIRLDNYRTEKRPACKLVGVGGRWTKSEGRWSLQATTAQKSKASST
jgi:hypothetical protein